MLTRKPSAAAPAAYPTGKEGRAATPPRAPAPAGPRAARVQPSWRGRPLPAGPRTKSARRLGPPSGRRALASAPLIVARRPQGSTERSPATRPAGAVPGLFPTPPPPPGFGEAIAPLSAVQSSSRPVAACDVGRPAPAQPGSAAGSRTRAPAPDLTLQLPEPRPGLRAWDPGSGRPFTPPDACFYRPASLPGRAGSLPRGVGRGDGVWVTFSPLTLFCLLPRVAPRPRRGQRRSSASGFPGARCGGSPERSGHRPALPDRPAASPGQQRCRRSPHGETQPRGRPGGRGAGGARGINNPDGGVLTPGAERSKCECLQAPS